MTVSCMLVSVTTPTTTTATTAATAKAGLSQAAAGPRRLAVLVAGVWPLWAWACWLIAQRNDSSRTDSRIR
jgi:hypothetical protein